jgi:TetR/AcrR family transcriptional regulator, transcriptional repressor for nem operon
MPKKRNRDLEASRKVFLEAGFQAVYTRGFQGVSVDDVVKMTALTKGAFYNHFPAKLDLGYALVEEVISPMIIDRWITPLNDFKDPFDGILFLLKKHIGEHSFENLKYGCPLNNLMQEMAPVDLIFKRKLQKAIRLWIDETAKHILRGQTAGYIAKDLKAQAIAEFIVMAHEGFFGLIKGIGDQNVFLGLYASLKKYFESLSGPVKP